MKKSFLLLPFVAAFALTACSSNNSAEVSESSSDTLPNGGTWQPADIQPTSMPNGMNQPISQPSYTPAPVTITQVTVHQTASATVKWFAMQQAHRFMLK